MAAETHPSSSSSSDNYDYDVFLSFRGEDTRGNITDHLYTALIQAGIRTFRDNEELIHGEEIGSILLKSIEQSRISIPIISKNYASSKWCLHELTKMMECKKTCGQIVWPIFYKVEPSHVWNQTGCFKKAFLKHKKEQCEETVRTWRQALKEAANLKGWDSEDPKNRYETNLINSIVERALSELIRTNLQVAEHPIGIDSHVKEVMRMLDFESHGVQFVGIHGMGGIGKTTIAKAVFNNISYQFESWSFLADVRERASQCRGLVNLQNKLAYDLLKGRNLDIDIVDSGINVIKKMFGNKKVLIVLDDVDQDDQLRALVGGRDWFDSGSRIIITTRDEHILYVDQVAKSKIYKPNELDENLSLQLFSKHAFGRDQPPQDFRELSKTVVSIVGGLPLALKVLGSFLRDKREDTDWEDTLKMLKELPHEEVQKRLKISYDGLNSVFKKLFLDIACFFIGMDKESVTPAWEACDYFPTIGIKVLVYKSLVKIDNDNKLRMHDQLRDMGREIVRQENPDKPGERSRLWSHEKALDVLKNYELIGMLKVLDLSSCDFLKRTPHFPRHAGLERLILDYCKSLVVFHKSIGHLQKLVFLSLKRCENLMELPDNICKLSSIRSLILSDCLKLEKLPKELGNMESLTELIIDRTRIEELPNSIGLLEGLERLSARGCWNLRKFPNMSNLKSLQVLCLSDCWGLFEIQGISGLSLLQQIDLENCRSLTLLPELPPGLIKLNIRRCTSMERLPNLSTLKNLNELCLDNCYKLAKIEGINGLTLLQELDLTDCRKLQSLPELPSSLIKLNATDCNSIERLPNLSNLKILQALLLCGCQKLSKIQGINDLSLLQQLDLKLCVTLQSLPELPPSLIRLDVSSCISMKRLPNLSTMKHLKEFSLVDCSKLVEIEGIDEFTLLEELDSTDCMKLQSLPELPSSLIKLDARYCGSIETLPNLSNLKNLQVFHLCCKNLSEIQDISGLSLLQELDLEDCKMLQSLPGLPPSLIRLEIKGYISMKRLPNLSSFRSLKVLRLKNCMNLANIQGINDLSLLQTLHLDSCRELQSLDLSNLRILKSLRLEYCGNLAEIRGLESLESLIELQVRGCYTCVKTLPKSVAEGMLPTAFNEGEIWNDYLIIPDNDNIKGMIFFFVYTDPALFWPIPLSDIFSIEAEIQRNDGKKPIRCFHNLRVEGMKANTNKYRFYSCYFQGLTWFGFPLKKRDLIHFKRASFDFTRVKVKMYDLVMEYEAMEDSQQLEKRVVPLITSRTKKGPPEYDDADYQKKEYDDAGPSNWKLWG